MDSQYKSLRDRITEDMKVAMKGQDKQRLGAIRLILAAIKQREVDERIVLNDDQIISILEKMVKQRKESISLFETAGRTELVLQEKFELEIITSYFPPFLPDNEIMDLINNAILEVGATSMSDMGRVMNILRTRIKGRADMSSLSHKVQMQLSS